MSKAVLLLMLAFLAPAPCSVAQERVAVPQEGTYVFDGEIGGFVVNEVEVSQDRIEPFHRSLYLSPSPCGDRLAIGKLSATFAVLEFAEDHYTGGFHVNDQPQTIVLFPVGPNRIRVRWTNESGDGEPLFRLSEFGDVWSVETEVFYSNRDATVSFDRAGLTLTPQGCPDVEAPEPGVDQPVLPSTRHPVLFMEPATFSADTEAQNTLFTMAQGTRARQEAFGEHLLAELDGGGEVVSILKRPTQEAFVAGVIAKAHRNDYEFIGQMDDMVRGRFDLNAYCDVHALAYDLLWEQPTQAGTSGSFVRLDKTETPRRPVDVPECNCQGYGYPRYHVIVQDAETGITHEWQIGNEAVSQVYEMHGVDLPPGMDLDFEQGHIGADLHDIDYDIFRQGVKSHDREHGENMYQELGLEAFGEAIDQLSAAAACQGEDLPDLEARIRNLHDAASALLHRVVDHYGLEQVRAWYH